MKAGQYSRSQTNCEVTANLVRRARIHPLEVSDMQGGEKLWKSALAGAAAGLAASWTMNQFQAAWTKIQQKTSGESQMGEDEDATMKAANFAAEKTLHRELSKEEKKKVAPYFHYGFGTLMGVLYGILTEEFPSAKAGFGTAFATGLFLVADEGAVPALKLGDSPKEAPLSSHLETLASHLVYGLSTESVRRGVRAALGQNLTVTVKSKAQKAKHAAVHWEVETRHEIPKKIKRVKKTARRKWEAAA
jgi:putative membrane protein